MNEDIIRMAKKAGIDFDLIEENESHWYLTTGGIKRFAELIRADEREACAKVCDAFAKYSDWPTADNCAAAIRARNAK